MTRPLLLIGVFAIAASAAAAQTPREDDRTIALLAGDLYRVRAGRQHTVFLATRDGIVVVDPLNVATAQWLNEQLAARFPGVPVRYVVVTHHHADRASGNGIFGRNAVIVGHAEFRPAVDASRRRAPDHYRFVASPAQTVTDRRVIELGGNRIELVHTGPFHSPDMLAVGFANERVLFVADPPPVSSSPFHFGSLRNGEVVTWLERVAPVDVDRIVFDDGTELAREAVAPLAEYLGRMRRAVLDGYERGRSLRTLQDTVRLEAYRALPHYAGRAEQIEAIFRQVSFIRSEFVITGRANYLPENAADFCAGFDRCHGGGAVPAGTAALNVAVGRRFGLQGEVTVSEQLWSTRGRPLYDEETVLRPFTSALLVRVNLTRSRSVTLLGGLTTSYGDVRGMDRVQGRLVPVGGRHAIRANDMRRGVTAGIDLSPRLGALRVVMPVRVTQTSGTRPDFWPSRINVSIGAGFAVPIFRRLQ